MTLNYKQEKFYTREKDERMNQFTYTNTNLDMFSLNMGLNNYIYGQYQGKRDDDGLYNYRGFVILSQ